MKRFLLTLMIGATPVGATQASDATIVSQRGLHFSPSDVKLPIGSSLTIVNDDGTVVHHAYVESDTFNFDSGDQKPGDRVVIPFPGTGKYTVLCGVHPKMVLNVTVK
jgi:plastocyanin